MANNNRPITFNAEMIRAILDGRKTQTRRIMKPGIAGDACPFGQPGDRLWVRETWQGPLFDLEDMEAYAEDSSKFENPNYCQYAADGGPRPEYVDADDNLRHGWCPSIHMPRWASRITLEITGVRVERLNDISDQDALAEGCSTDDMMSGEALSDVFGRVWRDIYGADSWFENPWVWCISFRRVANDGE
jgi:hypothetical protein